METEQFLLAVKSSRYSQLNSRTWPQSKGKTPQPAVLMRLSCQMVCEWLKLWVVSKSGFAKNRPTARVGPAVRGARPMMARRPSPDFPPFFVQRLIHAHAQVCIGVERAKWTTASLNSFTIIINNYWMRLSMISWIIVSITKFSIAIGSPRTYLSRYRRAITCVSDYRCPIWTFSNRTPVIG